MPAGVAAFPVDRDRTHERPPRRPRFGHVAVASPQCSQQLCLHEGIGIGIGVLAAQSQCCFVVLSCVVPECRRVGGARRAERFDEPVYAVRRFCLTCHRHPSTSR